MQKWIWPISLLTGDGGSVRPSPLAALLGMVHLCQRGGWRRWIRLYLTPLPLDPVVPDNFVARSSLLPHHRRWIQPSPTPPLPNPPIHAFLSPPQVLHLVLSRDSQMGHAAWATQSTELLASTQTQHDPHCSWAKPARTMPSSVRHGMGHDTAIEVAWWCPVAAKKRWRGGAGCGGE